MSFKPLRVETFSWLKRYDLFYHRYAILEQVSENGLILERLKVRKYFMNMMIYNDE